MILKLFLGLGKISEVYKCVKLNCSNIFHFPGKAHENGKWKT